MEVVGVFLGAVALIFPVYEGLGRPRDRLSDAKNFPRDFQRLGWNLFTQKTKFGHEVQCLLLLCDSGQHRGIIGAMVQDKHHEKWRDPEFRQIYRKRFCSVDKGNKHDVGRTEN